MIIQTFRRGVLGSSDFFVVIEDIIFLFSRFQYIIWSFIKRSGNKVAHFLSHFQPVELCWHIGWTIFQIALSTLLIMI